MTKDEIKRKYGVPSYRNWKDVPANLETRTGAARRGYIIPLDAKPDAVKNSSNPLARDMIYFLFNLDKYKKQP